MSETVRYPYLFTTSRFAPELPLVITILPATTGTLPVGGLTNYVSVAPWKTAGERSESPYDCVSIELSSNTPMILGNGTTELVGLYGQINLVQTPTNAAQRKRTLLAVLGINAGAALPQIPFVQQAAPANDAIGLTLPMANIAAYDALSVGGVLGDVVIPENATITVVARPLRKRDYLG